MSASVGVLDFFVVEAAEYIERLDALLASAGDGGPDASEFLRHARSLRGSSTMAKQYGISRVAAALEQAARALKTGAVRWDPAVNAIFIAAVENLKILMRNVRAWSTTDEQRAQARVSELERLAPPATPAAPPASSSSAFLISETATLADALEQLIASPTDRESASAVLEQVRALRGVAAIRDVAPLPDVIDVVERVARALERGSASATSTQLSLCSVAAGVLRRASGEVAAGRRLDLGSPEVQRFHTVLNALGDASTNDERVVPIAELFYADAGPHIVQATASPLTTPPERFRLEIVSQAEHVRRVVDQARSAPDPATAERLATELRSALHSLERAADSFGEHEVAQLVRGWRERMFAIDASALSALDGAAALLANPETGAAELLRTLQQVDANGRSTTPPADPRRRFQTPTGQTLVEMLERGIEGLDRLSEEPLREPAAIPQDQVVPIEDLLYRGPSALERALEVRKEIRSAIHRVGYPPPETAIGELLDLLELAVTD